MLLAGALSACAGPLAAPDAWSDSPAVLALAPANASVAVDRAAPVVVTFTHPIMIGTEALVVLHEGPVTGPVVAGGSAWSADRTVLTFTPSGPLKALTTYTLHLSPAIRSVDGRPVNLEACRQLGGRYATAGMIGVPPGGSMMNGAWGPGMMGAGWRAADGTFGMIFTFATA